MYLLYTDTSEAAPSFPWGFLTLRRPIQVYSK